MKFITNIYKLLLFLRKASNLGFIFYLGRHLNSPFLFFVSFVFAPIVSLSFVFKKKEQDLAHYLEKLGPIFVKFGQILSSMPELIGEERAESLSKLQDKLAPFDYETAIRIIKHNIKRDINKIFAKIDSKPVAAASIAQVHKAELLDGTVVAVKILRPNIKQAYENDIRLLYILTNLAKTFIDRTRHLRLNEIVKLLEKTMKSELDFTHEAANCLTLKDNLKNDENILVPEVFWELTSSEILVMEWVDGVSVYDKESIKKLGLDSKRILQKLAIAFFNQAFRDGYFHADIHPGNILVTKDEKIAFIDFGIMGFLSERDRIAMAEVLHSLLHNNYYRVAEIHKDIGFISNNVNLYEFAIACRAISEPIVKKSYNNVSVGHLLNGLFKMTSEFGMQTQPQLIMLQKTILILEGIGQILAKEVNMWHLAEPWIKQWAKRHLGFDAKLLRCIKAFIEKARFSS
ncbi:MAG: 2-polyprenylphenol 6-hydroxylase [Rickettsiaceae bacterium]|nr:2-polyprenylphenol 6-hydroxylase [Rickettsiaceae bacterium]